MAAVTTGSKTVSNNASPFLTAAYLTNLMTIAVENLTLGQLKALRDAADKLPFGGDEKRTVGSIFI